MKHSWLFAYIVTLALLVGGAFFYFKSNSVDVNFFNLPGSDESELIFVGDIMLSRNIGRLMVEHNDWSYPFELVKDYLRSADLTFGNFENPISLRGILSGSIYSFKVDPRALKGMSDAGFDVVSVANNHIWDYGREAFEDTLIFLTSAGISPVGGGQTFDEAHTPIIREVNGTLIAFLAYTRLLPSFLGKMDATPAVAYPNADLIAIDVYNAKKAANIVVTSFHWGEEYQTTHNPEQEYLAHTAIDAGADLVIGHHPHVIQEVQSYKHGYIAYSLGNFVFDQNFSSDTSHGLLLKVHLKDKKISRVEPVEVKFNSTYQPFVEG